MNACAVWRWLGTALDGKKEGIVCVKDHNNSEILIYQSENGVTKIDVTFML